LRKPKPVWTSSLANINDQVFDYPGTPPALAPLSYPGAIPGFSYLLLNQRIVPLAVKYGWREELKPPRPKGRSLSPLGTPNQVNHALLQGGQPLMQTRVPVVVVGSNASPAQLWRKFEGVEVSPIMPLTLAEVTGIKVGVCAYISKNGYLPSTAIFDPEAKSKLFIQWLSKEQLDVVDRTEIGYRRVELEPHCKAILECGEIVNQPYVYVCKFGYLVGERFPNVSQLPVPEGFQAALIRRILGMIPELSPLLSDGVENLVEQVRNEDWIRMKINEVLQARGSLTQP